MEHIKTDLCIIGAAGAGLSAALKATELGKRVLVLEKMPTTGGCTKMAGGIFGIESPVQERLGLSYTADECFADLIPVLNWNCESKLVRKWLQHAGENIRILEELGVEFSDVTAMQGTYDRVRRLHHITADNTTGLNIWKALQRACDERGIDIRVNTRAEHLIVEDARVTGVTAQGPEGALEVRCEAVVLATGSISANKELIRRFYSSDAYRDIRIMANVPHNTGDGLIMAEEVGAQTALLSTLYIGPHNHFPGASEGVGCLPRRPHLIKVDRNGERFINESWATNTEFGWMQSVAIDRLPGKVCYAIMDEALYRGMFEESREPIAYIEKRFNRNDSYPGEWIDKLDADIAAECAAGRACKADSIEELAEYIGADTETLLETIEHYNACCDAGYDDEFLKDPKYMYPIRTAPFYAFRGPSGIDTCIGGLRIDHRQRVLDLNDRAIPGLYAAGVLTSGWLSHFYGFPGTEMSYTLFSGRNAGEQASSYISSGRNAGHKI